MRGHRWAGVLNGVHDASGERGATRQRAERMPKAGWELIVGMLVKSRSAELRSRPCADTRERALIIRVYRAGTVVVPSISSHPILCSVAGHVSKLHKEPSRTLARSGPSLTRQFTPQA
jgi:hypothetical protein